MSMSLVSEDTRLLTGAPCKKFVASEEARGERQEKIDTIFGGSEQEEEHQGSNAARACLQGRCLSVRACKLRTSYACMPSSLCIPRNKRR